MGEGGGVQLQIGERGENKENESDGKQREREKSSLATADDSEQSNAQQQSVM